MVQLNMFDYNTHYKMVMQGYQYNYNSFSKQSLLKKDFDMDKYNSYMNHIRAESIPYYYLGTNGLEKIL